MASDTELAAYHQWVQAGSWPGKTNSRRFTTFTEWQKTDAREAVTQEQAADGELKQRPEDQNLPVRTQHSQHVQDKVVELIRERQALGLKRYGQPGLFTHNGRDALRDALEEALDLACYLCQAWMEQEDAS